jgi:Protein of unknown function (DUF692)
MFESRNPPMTAHGGARFPSIPLLPRAGAGLKPEHVGDILANKDSVGFFEIHAENYMGARNIRSRFMASACQSAARVRWTRATFSDWL